MNALTFVLLLVIAALVEAIVQTCKWLYEKGFVLERIIAFIVAIGVTILAGLDVFTLVGAPLMLPYVGSALTGILLARGATVAHDVFKYIQSLSAVTTNKLDW